HIFGCSSREIVGRPVSVILGDNSNLQEAMQTFDGAIESGRTIEMIGRTRNSTRIDFDLSASRWQAQGRSYVTAILRDITERKAGERALLQINRSLETAVAERTADRDRMWRLSSDLMLIAHLDGRIVATNPASSKALGWSEARLLGESIRDLIIDADLALWDAEVTAA